VERNIISWNITNWLTVILMVSIGYVVIGAAISLGRQWAGGDLMDAAAAANGVSMDA
jgi:hypothetical protein